MSKIVRALIPVCFLLLWTTRGDSQEISKDPVEKILSGDRSLIGEGKKEILSNRSQQIKRLLDIVKDTALRTKNRPAVVAAIELLGELKADEAAPELAGMLLFGEEEDIHAPRRILRTPPLPDESSPAVAALIKIGIPSLKPVTEQLVAITENTPDGWVLKIHCLWVIKGVLGPRLGKAYLTQLCEKDERAAKSQFVKDGFRFMDLYMFEEKKPEESKQSERSEPEQPCLTPLSSGQEDTSDNPLTVEEVRKLISWMPYWDVPDPALAERFRKTVALGERLIPAFITILEESNDPYEISAVLTVSREIQGDKSALFPSVKKLLERDNKWVRISAVWALRDIGGIAESATLLQCLDDEDQGVRKVAAESLGKIGDAETAKTMEAVLERRKAGMTLEQMAKDTSVAALEKAISDIRERVGKKESEAKPVVKEQPQPEEKPAPKPIERRETVKEGTDWLLPGLIIIGFMIAGVVLFLLLRRRKA